VTQKHLLQTHLLFCLTDFNFVRLKTLAIRQWISPLVLHLFMPSQLVVAVVLLLLAAAAVVELLGVGHWQVQGV
jgi:hypothetical protein